MVRAKLVEKRPACDAHSVGRGHLSNNFWWQAGLDRWLSFALVSFHGYFSCTLRREFVSAIWFHMGHDYCLCAAVVAIGDFIEYQFMDSLKLRPNGR